MVGFGVVDCSWKRAVLRYLSPVSGRMTTISLPLFSGRFAISKAAYAAAPEDMPTSKPSFNTNCLAVCMASSSFTLKISSTKSSFNTSGLNPAPMPWILCGPFWPPLRTAEAAGSTATALKSGLNGLMYCAMPVIVPPVPTPATTMSTLPSVSFQISGPVVSLWIFGFAKFLNCCGTKLFLSLIHI